MWRGCWLHEGSRGARLISITLTSVRGRVWDSTGLNCNSRSWVILLKFVMIAYSTCKEGGGGGVVVGGGNNT